MNLFYNFGRKIQCRDFTDQFMKVIMKTQQYDEGLDLMKYYRAWLNDPPKRRTVYSLATHFMEQKEYMKVRELVEAYRNNWQLKLTPSIYK